MNIITSGWPGAGATTMSLILAYLLGYKYMYAGGVMKHIATKKINAISGPEYVKFEAEFGPKFDKIWEKYVLWKLQNSDNLLVEAKTAGFFQQNKEKNFSIMLIANVEARQGRAEVDNRLDAAATVRARDFEVRQRWFENLNIDMYNLNSVREHYNLVVDNSHISVAEEIDLVVNEMEKDGRFSNLDYSQIRSQIAPAAGLMVETGKQGFREMLKSSGLLITSSAVIEEWIVNFGDMQAELEVNFSELI